MKKPLTAARRLLLLLALVVPFSSVLALDTSFTYQGRLNNGSGPANGLYDFQFALSNAPSGGGQIGSTVTSLNVGVTNGLFTTTLDFGSVFTGQAAWLAIGLRTNGGSTYAGLMPLQPLTPTPYAVFANSASNVSGTVSASQLSGIIQPANLNASQITSGTLADAQLSANVALRAGGNSFSGNQVVTGGNVGIGTNNPSSALQVIGTVTATSFSGNGGGLTNLSGSQVISVGNTNGGAFGNFFVGSAGNASTTGFNNTAVGSSALQVNTSGAENTAIGLSSLVNNLTGARNTALGVGALAGNTGGANNIGLGWLAGFNLPPNSSSNIDIGSQGGDTDNNIIRIGNGQASTFIAGVINGNGGGLTNISVLGPQVISVGNGNGGSSGNFFVGSAGNAATTGSYNTALGDFSLGFNSVGTANTAVGQYALGLNTNGVDNTVVGSAAMKFNVNGSQNTAVGSHAFINAGSGSHNIALGASAGSGVGDGSYNIEIGSQGANGDDHVIRIGDVQTNTFIAGVINGNGGGVTNVSVLGSQVISIGNGNSGSAQNFFVGPAGNATMTGSINTAVGYQALQNNAGGSENSAFGNVALFSNTSGSGNTAIGNQVLQANSTGLNNTVVGHGADFNGSLGSYNTIIGALALFSSTTGSNNIALGYQAGLNLSTGSFNIDIGNGGLATDTNIIRIGSGQSSTFIAGVINGNGGGLTNLSGANVSGVALLAGGNTFSGSSNIFSSKVGIGIGNPQHKLDVKGNIFMGTAQSGAAFTEIGDTLYIGAPLKYLSSTLGAQIEGSTDWLNLMCHPLSHGIMFGTAGPTDADPHSAPNPLMVIQPSGNVGIGITAPGKKLEIAKGVAAVASGSSIDASVLLRLDNTNTDGSTSSPNMVGIGFGQNSTRQAIVGGTFGNDVLDFYTGGTLTAPKMRIDFNGRVGIGVLTLTHPLDMASGAFCSVAGVWTSVSDRSVKEHFTAISPAEVLSKVAAMPITEWKYKAEPDGTEHIGPMAQDFHAAFGLNGADDKHISSIDEDGVALAAIQGLNEKLNEKYAEVQTLKAQNDSLAARLDKLEAAMKHLAANR